MSANAEIAKKIAADLHPTEEGPEGETSLRDLVITALEGGINYWGYVERYRPNDPDVWATVTEGGSARAAAAALG